jgi:hypothetical protein
MPTTIEKTSMRIGSFIGSNHIGLIENGLLKKVVDITVTASPNQLPNNAPQKTVDSPQKKNMRRVFLMLFSILGNLQRQIPQPTDIISP